MFWTSMLLLLAGHRPRRRKRLKAADMLPHATETMTSMPGLLDFYAERIDAGVQRRRRRNASAANWPASAFGCRPAQCGTSSKEPGSVRHHVALARAGVSS
ncbi:hypothetical protein [Microtetraspora sp. NBRC 16547]|uniref:imine reductase family protein n=1 Tax=Microtetraspora sp. NBRC 16547 TaxID=3030993 RepID=UPI003320C3A2